MLVGNRNNGSRFPQRSCGRREPWKKPWPWKKQSTGITSITL